MEASMEYVIPNCLAATPTLRQRKILVDNSGHARIGGFGLYKVTRDFDPAESTPTHRRHNLQFPAPEVLMGGVYSKKADIFSFAMVMVEVRHESPCVLIFGLLSLPVSPGIHW